MTTTIINRIAELVNGMEGITPEDTGRARLMRRRDTKYVVSASLLPEILDEVKDDYYAMYVGDTRLMPYRTVYYDTPNFDMYNAHHNGRRNRYKIRMRTYETNQLTFLEVKHKNNKGITNKQRIEQGLADGAMNRAFVDEHSPYRFQDIEPVLQNSFYRIMLVNKHHAERVTIDYKLKFVNTNGSEKKKVPNLVIVEVKRDLDGPVTKMMEVFHQKRIKAIGFSKYCIGTALINPRVRYNLFKQRLRMLGKMEPAMQLS